MNLTITIDHSGKFIENQVSEFDHKLTPQLINLINLTMTIELSDFDKLDVSVVLFVL